MSELIDFTRIQETSDGDMEFEIELIGMYLEDASEHVDTILQLLDAADWEALKSPAHTLKGSSANIGATGLQEVATLIEKCATMKDSSKKDAHSSLLRLTLAKTSDIFNAYVAEHS